MPAALIGSCCVSDAVAKKLSRIELATLHDVAKAGGDAIAFSDWDYRKDVAERLLGHGLVKVVPAWNEFRREAVPAYRVTPAGIRVVEGAA